MDKIFGTMGSYYQNADKMETYGAISVSYSFIKNLLQYGTFDRYVFSLPPAQVYYFKGVCEKGFKEFIRGLSLPADILKKISVDPLDSASAEKKYTVFHNSGPDVSKLHYFRDILCNNGRFPIVNFVHAIAPQGIGDWFLKNILSSSKPYDAHICPSSAVARSLSKYYECISQYLKECHGCEVEYRGRFEILPLGVDTSRIKPGDRNAARKKLKLRKDRVIILCLTRLTPFNKMDLLPMLQAFKTAVGMVKDKNVLFLIAGKEQFNNYAESLKKCASLLGISNNVEIRKNIPNSDVPDYYNASDIFLSLSDNLQETFGLTPIEAMLSKIPVVISDWNGYKEVLTDGETGFKVPVIFGKCNSRAEKFSPFVEFTHTLLELSQSVAIDIEKTSDILARLINDPELRERVAEKAYHEAFQRYSWKKVIPRYEQLYGELSKESNNDLSEVPYSRHFSVPPYYDAFEHYPSNILENTSKIKRSEYGSSWLMDKKTRMHCGITSIFNEDVLAEIVLNGCKEWTEMGNFLPLLSEIEKEKFIYQILNMIKHGLLICKP